MGIILRKSVKWYIITIKEIKLPINTFNPYTGWCQLHDGILFFVDKITDQEISEDLEVHIFHPVMIKND